jgi:hypothetical protein
MMQIKHHRNTVIPTHYELMEQRYGAKLTLEVVNCTISSAFFHAPPCPAAFANQLYSPFTAKLAQ